MKETEQHQDASEGPLPRPASTGTEDRDGLHPLRILVVTWTMPYPPTWGYARRTFHLTTELARRNQVTVLSHVSAEDDPRSVCELRDMLAGLITVPRENPIRIRKRLQQAGSLLSSTPFHSRSIRNPKMQRALDDALARDSFDVVVLESSVLGWLKVSARIPVVIDEHNIESELLIRVGEAERSTLRRWYGGWEHLRYRRWEDKVWRASSGCVTTAQRDADAVAARVPGQSVVVVPNGVDIEEFQPTGSRPDPDSLVFTGLLDYRPNVDGINWFLREVLPRIRAAVPSAHLSIIGRGPDRLLDSLRQPGVTVTGWVPEVPPYLDRAAVVVVPLRMGGGTRLKIVEALAMAKATVSTTLGAEGIEVVPGEHLEIGDDAVTFADRTIDLLLDPERARLLGIRARQLAVERYSWSTAGVVLEGFLRQIAGNDHDRGAR